jgi:hypothetical protein
MFLECGPSFSELKESAFHLVSKSHATNFLFIFLNSKEECIYNI